MTANQHLRIRAFMIQRRNKAGAADDGGLFRLFDNEQYYMLNRRARVARISRVVAMRERVAAR
jgi:hypothetical protein